MLAAPDKIIVCPGVHDGLTARVALSVGFDALYMSGAGTAASRLGQPDLGLTTAVARTAEKYILQGAAAFHLEDQVMAPTPCLLNMVGGGVTPLITAREAQALGFKVVIWPIASMTSVYLGMREFCRELKSTGEIKDRHTEDGKIDGGVRDVFELCGPEACVRFDEEVGGASFANGA